MIDECYHNTWTWINFYLLGIFFQTIKNRNWQMKEKKIMYDSAIYNQARGTFLWYKIWHCSFTIYG
jgi:hypothetical protein